MVQCHGRPQRSRRASTVDHLSLRSVRRVFPPEVHREVTHAAYEISAAEIAAARRPARFTHRHHRRRERPGLRRRGLRAANERGYELFVSIADVAYYVRPETALDQEAYARATSVYFPDRAIPMLPEALSNGICSLNPNEDRLTKTACIEFNGKGEVDPQPLLQLGYPQPRAHDLHQCAAHLGRQGPRMSGALSKSRRTDSS